MTTLVKKARESNLELYRIIVMLLIVSHHYVVNSGLFEQLASDRLAPNAVFFYLFGMWGKTGINCFVLITGYFMCTSRITLQKFLTLLLQVLFYVFVLYLLFCAVGYQKFSLMHFIYTMNPIKTVGDGFTSCYLLFFLFIPFLNILVQHMGERRHRLLALLLFVTYTLTSSIPYIHVTMNYVTWFCVLYIYASYIRLYASDKFSTRFWGWASVGSIALSMLSVYACLWFGKEDVYFFVADSNKILALLTAICTFNWFRKIRLKRSRFINTVSASTFGVLLIHANSDVMRQWLWKDTIDCCGHANISYYPLYAFGVVLGIYMVCTVIDQIRIHCIEKYYLPFSVKLFSRILPN